MEREDLRKTQEMPIPERNGGAAWLYDHDPLGMFSHRLDDSGMVPEVEEDKERVK